MSSTYDVVTGRVHFINLVREVVRIAYWHLPRVLAIGIIWTVFAITIVLAAPATAVAFAAGRSVLDREPFGVRDGIRAFGRYFWRAQAAFVPAFIHTTVTMWLWLQATGSSNLAPTILLFIAVDVLLLYCYLMLYYGPLLVDNSLQTAVSTSAERSTPSSSNLARASATTALTNVRTSVGLFFLTGSIAVLLSFTIAGFVLLAPGLLTMTTILAARYVFENRERKTGGDPVK